VGEGTPASIDQGVDEGTLADPGHTQEADHEVVVIGRPSFRESLELGIEVLDPTGLELEPRDPLEEPSDVLQIPILDGLDIPVDPSLSHRCPCHGSDGNDCTPSEGEGLSPGWLARTRASPVLNAQMPTIQRLDVAG
jgi:hypothetical protein